MPAATWSLAGLGVLGIVFGALPGGAGAECGLPNAVPKANWKYLREGGVDMPFGIYEHQWDAALLAGKVVKILVEERLGYHARFSGGGDSSNYGLYAMAGCKYPERMTTDPECGGDNVSFIHHTVMEVWGLHKVTVMQRRLEEWPHIIPESAGSMGYDGLEGMYVFNQPLTAAYADSGLALEYYKSFDATWHTPWTYFDEISAVNASQLRKCEDTYMMETIEVADYLNFTGDDEGVTMTDLGPVAKCWFGSFWLSPACRNAPETCILSVDGGSGWAINDFMQWATHHNIPIAYAVGATFSDFASIGQQVNGLPYWWQPDTTFIEFAPTRVIFPPYNAAERAEGNLKSGSDKIPLTKWMYPNLERTASRIREFLLRMSITTADMDAMLLDLKVTGSSHSTIACEWLKRETASWQSWIPSETSCIEGQGLVSRTGSFVANRSDAVGCMWCTVGLYAVPYSDEDGGTYVCQQCPVGTSQSVPGQTECAHCELGRYSDANASVECARCAVGTFQDQTGGTKCLTCPPPTTTLFMSAQTSSQCVCPSGMYQKLAGSAMECNPCPEAMLCTRPNSSEAVIPLLGQTSEYPFPEVVEGFMTLSSAALSPYKCKPEKLCPGGRPASCAANRDPSTVACSRCAPNHFLNQDGVCNRCEGGRGPLFMALALIAGIVALAMLVLAINKNSLQQRNSTSAIVIVWGLAFSSIQSMGAFNNLSVAWVEPFKTVFNALSFISFNIDGLEVECMFGADPVMKYAFRQLVVPVGVLIIACIIGVKKRFLDPGLSFMTELVNTVGALFQVFFISIVLSCTLPFVCYGHPGSNGFSMLSSPSVICYVDSNHTALMSIGIATFLAVVCPFVGMVAYGTLKYPQFVRESSANQGEGLRMFRFLFFRFESTAYFYGAAMLVRSLLICLVPVIFRDSAAFQVTITCGIFVFFRGLQLSLWSWRCRSANIADGATAGIMVLVLVCAALATSDEDLDSTLMVLGVILFSLLLACVLVAVAHGVYLRLFPSPYFDSFICHHKLHAAAQARLLQLMLQQKTGQTVFIDSDHLTDLDELFDIVRCRLGMLVVFLTSETLKRPWCAGEVTVTFMNHKRAILAKTASFLNPSPQQMQDLKSYIDFSSTSLMEYGITMDSVRAAFTWLLSGQVNSIDVDIGLLGRARFGALVNALVEKRSSNNGVPATSSMKESSHFRHGSVIVSSDPSDDEATAGAGILISMLNTPVLSMTAAGICMLADASDPDEATVQGAVSSALAVIVLLTSGSLECQQQLQVILAAMASVQAPSHKGAALGVIPVNTPGFQFPGEDYYSKTLPARFPGAQQAVPATIQTFFKRITVFLATNASRKVIEAQAMDVLARIPKADQGARSESSAVVSVPSLFIAEAPGNDSNDPEELGNDDFDMQDLAGI